jgi:hypothetical protein
MDLFYAPVPVVPVTYWLESYSRHGPACSEVAKSPAKPIYSALDGHPAWTFRAHT